MALELGHAGEPEGAVIIAEEQTAGRGRAGHSGTRSAPREFTRQFCSATTSAGAGSLADHDGGIIGARGSASRYGTAGVDLKWPNDLMIGGKKFGGILTEMHAEPTQIRFVIVGIGINVNQERFPAELAGISTSLRLESGRKQSRLEVLVQFLRQFERDYDELLREGASSVVRRFEAVSSYARGKRVRVTSGKESYTGVTAGLESEGLIARDPRRGADRDRHCG